MIRVKNLWLNVAGQGLFQRLDAESRIHGDRYTPSQNPLGKPVHHGGQIDEPTGRGYITEVRPIVRLFHGLRRRNLGQLRPHLVGLVDHQFMQEIRVDLTIDRRLG